MKFSPIPLRPSRQASARPGWRRVLGGLLSAVVIAVGAGAGATAAHAAVNAPCAGGTLQYTHKIAEIDPDSSGWFPAAYSSWELRDGTGKLVDQGTIGTSGAFRGCNIPATGTATFTFSSRHSGPDGKQAATWGTLQGSGDQYYSFDVPVTGGTLSTDGTTRDLGTRNIYGDMASAWEIVATLGRLAAVDGTLGSNCWSMGCGKVLNYRWGPQYNGAGVWNPSSTDVELSPGDPVSRHTVLHESGHWYQWALAGKFPVLTGTDATLCKTHAPSKYTTSKCAWTEGFANAIGAYAYGDRNYVWDDGYTLTFDTDVAGNVTQGTSNASGDNSEFAVTGALLELWNVTDKGAFAKNRQVLATMRSNLKEYIDARSGAGLADATAVLSDYSIDY